MADRFEAILPDTFFLHAADGALHRPVLLRTAQRDEFLLQTIGPDGRRVTLRGKDQAIVATQ